MKAHIVVKQYGNGASKIERVFSSKKRAWKWVEEFFVEGAKKDGWSVTKRNDYNYGDGYCISPTNSDWRETFYVVSEDVE